MLTKEQYRLLKRLTHNSTVSSDSYYKRERLFRYLHGIGYIRRQPDTGGFDITVTEKGKVELKIYEDDNARFAANTIISLCALVLSVLSIFIQIVQLLVPLLQPC